MNWAYYSFVLVCTVALVIGILGLCLVIIMPGIDRWSKNFFRFYFFIIILCCLSAIIEESLYYFTGLVAVIYFIWFFETLALSMLFPMLTIYLLHCSGESMKKNRLLQVVTGLWAVFFVLITAGIFIGGYSYVTPDMQYHRRSIYPLLLLPLTIIMSLNLEGLIRRRKKLSGKVFRAFLIAVVPMTVVLFVHMFVDVFALLDISIVLSAVAMYSFVLSDQIEQNLRYQREIANQRASITVLQMRPHFIYNTMTSIYCLCNQDPQRARKVIMDFTTYLRRNFTAVASQDPIPFSAELEHTRAYLAVEQAQYEDSLFVDFDTPHTYFRLPPLTLQPVVENSIKHGRNPYAGPFHISIRTHKTESGSEIVVEDDGCGFVPGDDNEPHLALKNIHERLEFMCGGSMTITSGDSGGTVVKIIIPDKSYEDKGGQ